MEKTLLFPTHEESSFHHNVICQYAATAKVIAAEVIVCYLVMLCKLKIVVLAWFSVFQVQYELFTVV